MFLYWIKRPFHKNVKTEGYVGITNDPLSQRFKEHKNTKTSIVGKAIRKYPDIEMKILFEGRDDICRYLEFRYRHQTNIGWNIVKGGGKGWRGKHSEETKIKMRNAKLGKPSWNKGLKNSLEHVAKMAESKSLNWIITYPNGKIETIRNLRKFSLEHNLDRASMQDVATGTRNQHKGFKCARGGVSSH